MNGQQSAFDIAVDIIRTETSIQHKTAEIGMAMPNGTQTTMITITLEDLYIFY